MISGYVEFSSKEVLAFVPETSARHSFSVVKSFSLSFRVVDTNAVDLLLQIDPWDQLAPISLLLPSVKLGTVEHKNFKVSFTLRDVLVAQGSG